VACQWPSQMTLAFNASAVQLKDATLPARILAILRETGLSPARLEVELTESALVQDLRGAKVERQPEAAALIRALMGLGHGLGLIVTAEGVELNEQAKMLLAHGFDLAQGYLYARAMPAGETTGFISAYAADAPASARSLLRSA
jgi:EAL domain-containing protein (putative c-di-GMP-specific phosphodiesterase class I)